MKEVILVGIGGFSGSILRYVISVGLAKYLDEKIYYATCFINLLGSLLIGLLVAYFSRQPSAMGLVLVVGFCGGFTTFSTFSHEGLQLIRSGLYLEYALYSFISILGGLLLCFLGFYFGSRGQSLT
ncbi:MAG: fluoride efflux transporter CrcB [Bacteroidota bacterium]